MISGEMTFLVVPNNVELGVDNHTSPSLLHIFISVDVYVLFDGGG